MHDTSRSTSQTDLVCVVCTFATTVYTNYLQRLKDEAKESGDRARLIFEGVVDDIRKGQRCE